MELTVVFGASLLVAVLLSALARRTVLSLPLLFLGIGVLVGNGAFGLVSVHPGAPIVTHATDVALFAVLFSDGMRAFRPGGPGQWHLPARTLLIAMPAAAAVVAVLTYLLTGLPVLAALLVAAVLAPTDPVLVSGLLRREQVPHTLRHTLNVESGLNDGLALPAVLVLIAALSTQRETHPLMLLLELAGGLALGVTLAAGFALLLRLPKTRTSDVLQPLGPLAIALCLFGAADLLHVNPYLAAFAAGAVLTRMAAATAEAFEPLGEQLSELAKFFALLLFGTLLHPDLLGHLSLGTVAMAVLVLVLARPLAVLLSLARTGFKHRHRLAVAWFGPKGLASVIYALYVLQSPVPGAERIFAIVALVVVLSIAVHTTTDVPLARRVHTEELAGA